MSSISPASASSCVSPFACRMASAVVPYFLAIFQTSCFSRFTATTTDGRSSFLSVFGS